MIDLQFNGGNTQLMRNLALKLISTSIGIALPCVTHADVFQASTSIQNSHFLGGINLSDDEPVVSLAADWTSNNGVFAGTDCSTSSVNNSEGIKSNCDFYAGYFKPIDSNQSVSFQFTRHEYSRGFGGLWDFNDLTANWHISKKTTFSTTYSKNWLNRAYDSLAINGNTQISLTGGINLNLSATVLALENPSPVSTLTFAKVSFSYGVERWTAEAGVVISDSDQGIILPFDVDQPDFSITFTYRLY